MGKAFRRSAQADSLTPLPPCVVPPRNSLRWSMPLWSASQANGPAVTGLPTAHLMAGKRAEVLSRTDTPLRLAQSDVTDARTTSPMKTAKSRYTNLGGA
jgi:hypothetical protein